eukprot:TRINITY_DN10342_c0_g1_i3.p1 TRINITY_DN10342_c0_g1~~TRINITY_DN10342_c0_g1_i3.p1  ORF type:complete len:419 (+),score=117.90 TRINITY_DN10342_c0_g1_i3:64-1320(+)
MDFDEFLQQTSAAEAKEEGFGEDEDEILYCDYNATTPVDPEVVDAIMPYLFQHYGNPSSSYKIGVSVKAALETARAEVAALLECTPQEILFVSCATESINLALKGAAASQRATHGGNHIITCATEHVAVLEVCRYLESQGFSVTYLPVDEQGLISESDLVAAISDQTILVSIMHANNEVGTVQDIARLARAAKRVQPHLLFHCDASQAAGKIEVNVTQICPVDLLTLAAHKIYAPKNCGVLYVRQGVQIEPQMHGAGQEGHLRAGTESVMMQIAMGKACALAKSHLVRVYRHLQKCRNRLEANLRSELEAKGVNVAEVVRVNGPVQQRLPNTLSISFRNVSSSALLKRIQHRVACSAGAACHSGEATAISHVLRAMNVPEEFARGTLRLSVGKMTTEEEVDQIVEIVADAVVAELNQS